MSDPMEYRDYYQTLGVDRNADADAIKKAYRKLARRYHPDVSKEKDAEEQFKAVSEAYEVLKDPEKRAAYDQFGSNWQQGQDFQPPPGWGRQQDRGFSQTFSEGNGDFSDFFETLFGARGGFGHGPSGFDQGRGGFEARSQDLEAVLEISLEDSYQGAGRTVTLNLPDPAHPGQSRTKTLNVKIPKGISAGQTIRLQGQGAQGPGGKAGNLLLKVAFAPHPQFTAVGKDIEVTVAVTPWQAALGRSIKIPTLGGEVSMTLPAGVRSGQRLRLKGRGLPGSPAGNQYAIIELTVPPATTDEIKDLYRALEAASS